MDPNSLSPLESILAFLKHGGYDAAHAALWHEVQQRLEVEGAGPEELDARDVSVSASRQSRQSTYSACISASENLDEEGYARLNGSQRFARLQDLDSSPENILHPSITAVPVATARTSAAGSSSGLQAARLSFGGRSSHGARKALWDHGFDEYTSHEDPGYIRRDVVGQQHFMESELELSSEDGSERNYFMHPPRGEQEMYMHVGSDSELSASDLEGTEAAGQQVGSCEHSALVFDATPTSPNSSAPRDETWDLGPIGIKFAEPVTTPSRSPEKPTPEESRPVLSRVESLSSSFKDFELERGGDNPGDEALAPWSSKVSECEYTADPEVINFTVPAGQPQEVSLEDVEFFRHSRTSSMDVTMSSAPASIFRGLDTSVSKPAFELSPLSASSRDLGSVEGGGAGMLGDFCFPTTSSPPPDDARPFRSWPSVRSSCASEPVAHSDDDNVAEYADDEYSHHRKAARQADASVCSSPSHTPPPEKVPLPTTLFSMQSAACPVLHFPSLPAADHSEPVGSSLEPVASLQEAEGELLQPQEVLPVAECAAEQPSSSCGTGTSPEDVTLRVITSPVSAQVSEGDAQAALVQVGLKGLQLSPKELQMGELASASEQEQGPPSLAMLVGASSPSHCLEEQLVGSPTASLLQPTQVDAAVSQDEAVDDEGSAGDDVHGLAREPSLAVKRHPLLQVARPTPSPPGSEVVAHSIHLSPDDDHQGADGERDVDYEHGHNLLPVLEAATEADRDDVDDQGVGSSARPQGRGTSSIGATASASGVLDQALTEEEYAALLLPGDLSDDEHEDDHGLEEKEDGDVDDEARSYSGQGASGSQGEGHAEALAMPRCTMDDKGNPVFEYDPEYVAQNYEIFDLRIIHKRHKTGFEETKDFPIRINDVIAGRYQVTDFLGSAAFSRAVQALDIQTGLLVCLKIIKNNKDYFDQSLDEIKLLKYINRMDPDDQFACVRLYDFFYYKEHLFLVCELLRANLYEFQKYNKESGEPLYFTNARIQRIAHQVLRSLAFLHSVGLIHSDLKPENILIKSYSRCEVKVIDLGSSCYITDQLSSYVQSRSYRAPEVILGLPYDHKIDVWSLGCILAELSSGFVLFQNDSLATLLARLEGIIGPIPQWMLTKGRYTHRFFTRTGRLYERNPNTQRYELITPKRSSLRHRMPDADDALLDFIAYLLCADPRKRPTAAQALQHPYLTMVYPDLDANAPLPAYPPA